MEFIDISPTITEDLAVFPGDMPFKRNISMAFKQGHHLDLSAIQGTLHLGAHTDAPSHYHAKGEGIDARDLSYYYGKCQVIEVKPKAGERVYLKDFKDQVQAERVLFKTNSFPNPNQWNNDFNSLSAEVIEQLFQQGVKLIGIDTPSIDPATDKLLPSHKKVFERNMAILEGIVLSHVQPGVYTLIALPLKIKDADASPVRAVLVKE